MAESYDTIVLGVGGFGSGALYHLARRGVRVLGIERFGIAHDRGSSHGQTRIIRKAYFEHPDYVPLVLRAYELWDELEAEAGAKLYHLCGLMLAGPPDGEAIAGAKLSAERYGIGIEEMTAEEASRRFPPFRFDRQHAIVFEPEAGYLEVENCVRAHIERAQAHRAVLRTGEQVVGWKSRNGTVRVTTDRSEYEAARLIVTAGPWAGRLLDDLTVPLEVVRKPMFWHNVETRDYDVAAGTPAYYFELPRGAFYGFPCLDGETIKAAEHTGGGPVQDPTVVDRDIHAEDIEPVADFLRQSLTGVNPKPARHAVCMYTHSPDRHFLIDKHPDFGNVVIGAGFSGHGFKFITVLGRALAELALDGKTDLPVGFLGLDRFRS